MRKAKQSSRAIDKTEVEREGRQREPGEIITTIVFTITVTITITITITNTITLLSATACC